MESKWKRDQMNEIIQEVGRENLFDKQIRSSIVTTINKKFGQMFNVLLYFTYLKMRFDNETL